MQSNEIREKFLKFFEKRGHVILPSASLVTTTIAGAMDATLFNTAGMQPFVPYLLGEPHPMGMRLVNVQKCLRTIDLGEVGDNTHNTFFEMLGNWSLGDYFKKEAIAWSYEFLTSKEEGLGLDILYLYVTVFGGNEKIGRDDESVEIWKSLGLPEHRIYYKSSKSNWWSAGLNSPAGPSTEMFYDITKSLGDMSPEEFEKAEDEQKVVEIWNDVFMSYHQVNGEITGELPQKNIDTGAGLERITTIIQGKRSMYETDLFAPIIKKIEELVESSELTDEAKDLIYELLPRADEPEVKEEILRTIRFEIEMNQNIADEAEEIADVIKDGDKMIEAVDAVASEQMENLGKKAEEKFAKLDSKKEEIDKEIDELANDDGPVAEDVPAALEPEAKEEVKEEVKEEEVKEETPAAEAPINSWNQPVTPVAEAAPVVPAWNQPVTPVAEVAPVVPPVPFSTPTPVAPWNQPVAETTPTTPVATQPAPFPTNPVGQQ